CPVSPLAVAVRLRAASSRVGMMRLFLGIGLYLFFLVFYSAYSGYSNYRAYSLIIEAIGLIAVCHFRAGHIPPLVKGCSFIVRYLFVCRALLVCLQDLRVLLKVQCGTALFRSAALHFCSFAMRFYPFG
ncbi:MAG: hypothetical protein IKJ42_08740, partial [Bacteroidaceae bacterium]|nr:hypothetical protein [Bacteroidaceae bacterium]